MNSAKQFFTQLFQELNSTDSWTVLAMLLGAFLIGFITNYFLSRRRIIRLEKALEESLLEKDKLKIELNKLQELYALREADLKKAGLELADKGKKIEVLLSEKQIISTSLKESLGDLDKNKEAYQKANNRIEDLNDQILGLRTKNAQLETNIKDQTANQALLLSNQEIMEKTADYEQQVANLAAENTLLKNSIAELKTDNTPEGTVGATLEITQLKDKITALEAEKSNLEDVQAELIQLETGNETLNATLTNLLAENDKLRDQLAELPQYEAGNEVLNNSLQTLMDENEQLQEQSENLIQYEAGNTILNTTIANLLEENDQLRQQLEDNNSPQVEWTIGDDTIQDEVVIEELDTQEARAKIKAAIGQQIVYADESKRDDLKQINGIGPFIEEKLNELGIYTFKQVSQLDDDLVETLTSAIEFFPNRIERDDWVGQADRLFYTQNNTPQEMASTSRMTTERYATTTEKIDTTSLEAATLIVEPDDLKKIEGIGPKIAQLLNDADIQTFAQLAATPVGRLTEILAAAGNRFKMHSPDTWPEQAQLAADGEWEKLQELQDYLDGGRDTAKG